MLTEGVLRTAIRANFWQPQKNERKWNWSNIDISVLSSTEWTYWYQKSCIQPCHGYFTPMPKRPKMCRSSSSSSSSHFLFPCDFSETIADRDIINTPLEPLLVDVPFEGYKTETKDLGGIFVAVWCREGGATLLSTGSHESCVGCRQPEIRRTEQWRRVSMRLV